MRTNPTLGQAFAGGVAGTATMTAMMYVVAPMMGLNMDIAAMLGTMLGGNWAAGMMMHLLNGVVVFPIVYAYGFRRLISGPEVLRGTAWAVVLWLLAQAMVMPMMGGGVFSSDMGGTMAAAGSLVGHLLYGALLGLVAGSGKRQSARA